MAVLVDHYDETFADVRRFKHRVRLISTQSRVWLGSVESSFWNSNRTLRPTRAESSVSRMHELYQLNFNFKKSLRSQKINEDVEIYIPGSTQYCDDIEIKSKRLCRYLFYPADICKLSEWSRWYHLESRSRPNIPYPPPFLAECWECHLRIGYTGEVFPFRDSLKTNVENKKKISKTKSANF